MGVIGVCSQTEETERKYTLPPEPSPGDMDRDGTPRTTNLLETQGSEAHINVKVVLKIASDLVMKC